jgi:hypothetical protein
MTNPGYLAPCGSDGLAAYSLLGANPTSGYGRNSFARSTTGFFDSFVDAPRRGKQLGISAAVHAP